MAFTIESSAFSEGEVIPKKFTCDGPNVSPSLSWRDAPSGTKAFALICDDPDAPAGTWVHWVIYNIPENVHLLPEGIVYQETLPDGSKQGINDFRRIGYGGPCPPKGAPHRYYFKLYALDTPVKLERASKEDLERAMKGHILGETRIMGKYSR